MEAIVVAAPDEGVWRVGRDPDPLAASWSQSPSDVADPSTGNRFDSPTAAHGVRYFATDLDACYGETLARFRADKKLQKIIGGEWRERGFMDVGDIPADWRQRRTAIHVRFPQDQSGQSPRFLDIESFDTREALLPYFEPLLAYYGYEDLDVPVVRGHDRRITRYISQWTFERFDDDDEPLYAGIRYLSRLNTQWECWAVFDRVSVEELTRHPILREEEALNRIGRAYGLKIY